MLSRITSTPPATGDVSDNFNEVLLLVVDQDFSSELLADFEFGRTARGDGNPGAESAGDLDSHRADTGAATVD
jgi:hypothetical protein